MGVGGHSDHISSLRRLSVRSAVGWSRWLPPDSSHSSDAVRSAARRSYRRVAETPHDPSLHRHRVLPDDVVPFFFIAPPQLGHKGVRIHDRQPHSNPRDAYSRNAPKPIPDTQSGQ